MMGIQNETEWARFCQVFLQRPELATDERFSSNTARVAHRDELNTLLVGRFTELDTSRAVGLLDEARIAHAGVNTVSEFLEHPVLTGRNRWREVATPVGDVRSLLPPIGLTGSEARMDPVPALGQHTTAVLAELGHSPADIERLRANGTLGKATS